MQSFGERLRKIRKNKNISLDKLAAELHTTKATLSRYENNLVLPNIEFANRIVSSNILQFTLFL